MSRTTTLSPGKRDSPPPVRAKGAARRRFAGSPVFIAVVLLAFYTVPLGKLDMLNPNEVSRIMLAISLSRHGTVELDRVVAVYGVPQDLATREGHYYTDKAPGLSLLAAPVVGALAPLLPTHADTDADYWPLHHVLTWLLISLPIAFFLGFASRDSRLAATGMPPYAFPLIFGLATPVLTYASVFFSHALAGILIASAYMLLRGFPEPRSELSRRRAFMAGLLASFAVVTEYPTILLAAVVTIALVADRRKRPALAAFAVGALLGAVPLLLYNKAAWGSFLTTGYAFKTSPEHAAVHAQGAFGVVWPTWHRLEGVLFSARRGLLFFCPLLLCVPLGWRRLWQTNRLDVTLSVIATLGYTAFAAGFVDWEGGWSAAARHLVPLLPLLFVPMAVGLATLMENSWSRVAAAGLVGWSIGASLLSVAVTPYYPEHFTNPLAQIALRSLGEGAAMRNLVSDGLGAPPLPVFLTFAAVALLSLGIAFAALLKGSRLPAMAALLVTLVLQPLMLTGFGANRPSSYEWLRGQLMLRLGYEELGRKILETSPPPSR